MKTFKEWINEAPIATPAPAVMPGLPQPAQQPQQIAAQGAVPVNLKTVFGEIFGLTRNMKERHDILLEALKGAAQKMQATPPTIQKLDNMITNGVS